MPTPTVENYLKRLYLARNGSRGDLIPMGSLATAMGVTPGTVTTMIKALADDGLVTYEPRHGVGLTSKGERLALGVIRRHRLVELFLVNVLGLDWSEVDPEAEQLEHVVSDRVLERMDVLLGHPTVDPHGDPIPNAEGSIQESDRASLADCATGVRLRVARVTDQDRGFLVFLERNGLTPGEVVTVEGREPAAGTVLVRRAAKGPAVSLGSAAAAKVLVTPA